MSHEVMHICQSGLHLESGGSGGGGGGKYVNKEVLWGLGLYTYSTRQSKGV